MSRPLRDKNLFQGNSQTEVKRETFHLQQHVTNDAKEKYEGEELSSE